MPEERVIRRLTVSRYLFELATQNARSDQEVAAFACVNLLQDAIEIFLVAASDHVGVKVERRTEFVQYLDKINEKTGAELPYRSRLIEINKVQVLSKHDGIAPNRKELQGYMSDGRSFLEEASKKLLNVDYWTVSLVELLDEREAKRHLLEAQDAFQKQDYAQCLICCRKAFYIEFEENYNVLKDDTAVGMLFASRAPYYTRDPQWRAQNILTPFDHIVLDHGQVDANLTKEGIDHTAFWNVWRLTPQVYRYKIDTEWLVKYDPQKTESEGVREGAAYALDNTVSILLARQANTRALRFVGHDAMYVLPLKHSKTTVYKKADKSGEVEKVIEGVTQVTVDYATRGLHDEEIYWHIYVFGEKWPFLFGFVLQEDLIFEGEARVDES